MQASARVDTENNWANSLDDDSFDGDHGSESDVEDDIFQDFLDGFAIDYDI